MLATWIISYCDRIFKIIFLINLKGEHNEIKIMLSKHMYLLSLHLLKKIFRVYYLRTIFFKYIYTVC